MIGKQEQKPNQPTALAKGEANAASTETEAEGFDCAD